MTHIGTERAQLDAILDGNRAELLDCLDGLTAEQARRRLVPSLTTLLGLVAHAGFAEQVWFQVTLDDRTRAEVGIPETVDESFLVSDADTVESVAARYRAICEESRHAAAGHDLEDVAVHHRRGPINLRWIYLHMIEELARHAGHADILREQILAADASDVADPHVTR